MCSVFNLVSGFSGLILDVAVPINLTSEASVSRLYKFLLFEDGSVLHLVSHIVSAYICHCLQISEQMFFYGLSTSLQ